MDDLNGITKGGDNMIKRFLLSITEELHGQIKKAAALNEINMNDFITKSVDEKLKRKEK